jgi:hypothetical protein
VLDCDSRRRFGLDIEFTCHLQTTNNYNTVADFHTLPITQSLFQPAMSSLQVAWWRLLIMAILLLPGSSPFWTTAPLQLPILASFGLLITPFARTEYKTPFPTISIFLHAYPLPRNVFTEPLHRNGSARYNNNNNNNNNNNTKIKGVRGSVVVWGTMLRAGRSRDLVPMR